MKTLALLTIGLFVVGAIAAPALADPDHEDDHSDAAKEKASSKSDKAADKAAERDERRAAHEAKHEERRNATIAKAQARCDAYENETGRDLPACDRLDDIYEHGKQARRAAHALIKAIDALEHRIVTLEKLEVKFMEKLEGDNLTANQTAAYEAKIVRIQAAQNKTLDKIEKMEERLDRLSAKWDKVRDHVDDKAKVVVCHQGEDGNKTIVVGRSAWAAHERHNDTRGPCADHDDPEAEDAFEAEEEEGIKDEDASDEPEGDPAPA